MLLLPLSAAPFNSVYNFMLVYHIIGIFSHLINFFFLCYIIIYVINKKRSCLLGKQLITRQYDPCTSQPGIFYFTEMREHTELAVQTCRCTGASSMVSPLIKYMQIIALVSDDSEYVTAKWWSADPGLQHRFAAPPLSAGPPRKMLWLAQHFDSFDGKCFKNTCWWFAAICDQYLQDSIT